MSKQIKTKQSPEKEDLLFRAQIGTKLYNLGQYSTLLNADETFASGLIVMPRSSDIVFDLDSAKSRDLFWKMAKTFGITSDNYFKYNTSQLEDGSFKEHVGMKTTPLMRKFVEKLEINQKAMNGFLIEGPGDIRSRRYAGTRKHTDSYEEFVGGTVAIGSKKTDKLVKRISPMELHAALLDLKPVEFIIPIIPKQGALERSGEGHKTHQRMHLVAGLMKGLGFTLDDFIAVCQHQFQYVGEVNYDNEEKMKERGNGADAVSPKKEVVYTKAEGETFGKVVKTVGDMSDGFVYYSGEFYYRMPNNIGLSATKQGSERDMQRKQLVELLIDTPGFEGPTYRQDGFDIMLPKRDLFDYFFVKLAKTPYDPDFRDIRLVFKNGYINEDGAFIETNFPPFSPGAINCRFVPDAPEHTYTKEGLNYLFSDNEANIKTATAIGLSMLSPVNYAAFLILASINRGEVGKSQFVKKYQSLNRKAIIEVDGETFFAEQYIFSTAGTNLKTGLVVAEPPHRINKKVCGTLKKFVDNSKEDRTGIKKGQDPENTPNIATIIIETNDRLEFPEGLDGALRSRMIYIEVDPPETLGVAYSPDALRTQIEKVPEAMEGLISYSVANLKEACERQANGLSRAKGFIGDSTMTDNFVNEIKDIESDNTNQIKEYLEIDKVLQEQNVFIKDMDEEQRKKGNEKYANTDYEYFMIRASYITEQHSIFCKAKRKLPYKRFKDLFIETMKDEGYELVEITATRITSGNIKTQLYRKKAK